MSAQTRSNAGDVRPPANPPYDDLESWSTNEITQRASLILNFPILASHKRNLRAEEALKRSHVVQGVRINPVAWKDRKNINKLRSNVRNEIDQNT